MRNSFTSEAFGLTTRVKVVRRRAPKAAKAPRVLSSRATGADIVRLWEPGMALPSLANTHRHWRTVKDIKDNQSRDVSRAMLGKAVWPRPPVAVLITRVYAGRQRPYDDDNATAAGKAVRDAVARQYGLDDNDPRIAFDVTQAKGPICGVRIAIVPVSAGTRAAMIAEAQRVAAPA